MSEIQDNALVFRFPDTHEDAEMAIELRRTLRVPCDGTVYRLPPSYRALPIAHIDQRRDGIPQEWIKRGGVMVPAYKGEAVFLAFSGGGWMKGYPFAVKIFAGKINAITGEPLRYELAPDKQDYIVVPRQLRLYGYCTAHNEIHQFVAMLLASGYPVPEQIAGPDEPGGIQIIVYPMKADRYERTIRHRYKELMDWVSSWSVMQFAAQQPSARHFRRPHAMSLAAGGRMRQPIYRDPFGVDAWDQSVDLKEARCFVTLADALQWQALTGQRIPHPPPTPAEFAENRLPWLDVYEEEHETLGGAPDLALARDLKDVADKKGEDHIGPDAKEIKLDTVIRLGPAAPSRA